MPKYFVCFPVYQHHFHVSLIVIQNSQAINDITVKGDLIQCESR